MCAVSMIHDYYKDRAWPLPAWGPKSPYHPGGAAPPVSPFPDEIPAFPKVNSWDREAVELLKEAIDRLEKLDKRLGDIECKDTEKTKWLQGLDDRLRRLERESTTGSDRDHLYPQEGHDAL